MTLSATGDDAGGRIDVFLASRLPDLSRSRLKALMRDGCLRSGGVVIAEPSRRVKPGERFELTLPPPVDPQPAPERLPLDIVFEDRDLIVLVKPAGMVVHPAAGHSSGTLVNALIAHCGEGLSGIGGVRRPGIVHRLDKDVSGVMVVAKNDRSHVRLAGQFSVHSVERVYDAVVWGVPERARGEIDLPIGRHRTDRKRMAVVHRGGKSARTRYELVRAVGVAASRLRLRLATGRTHQIRVHLESLGLGIIGDRTYGRRKAGAAGPATRALLADFRRIALHAHTLCFDHPSTGKRVCFERTPPEIFDELLDAVANDATLATDR